MPNVIPQLGLFEEAQNAVLLRVGDAFASGNLLKSELAVLNALCRPPRFGRDRAFSIAEIQQRWKIAGEPVYSDRLIKGAVKSLLEEYEIPIGSCRVPGMSGYFLIITAEDIVETERPLRNEIISLFGRLKAISPKSHFVRMLQGQMDILSREEKGETPHVQSV